MGDGTRQERKGRGEQPSDERRREMQLEQASGCWNGIVGSMVCMLRPSDAGHLTQRQLKVMSRQRDLL